MRFNPYGKNLVSRPPRVYGEKHVGTPYIMDGAAAPLRARYPLHTPRPEDVLREFLRK